MLGIVGRPALARWGPAPWAGPAARSPARRASFCPSFGFSNRHERAHQQTAVKASRAQGAGQPRSHRALTLSQQGKRRLLGTAKGDLPQRGRSSFSTHNTQIGITANGEVGLMPEPTPPLAAFATASHSFSSSTGSAGGSAVSSARAPHATTLASSSTRHRPRRAVDCASPLAPLPRALFLGRGTSQDTDGRRRPRGRSGAAVLGIVRSADSCVPIADAVV